MIEEEFEKCTCAEGQGQDEHTCPYASEMYNDESLCTCCPYCEEQCALDI
jgi:hypothetical protein